MLCKLRPRDFGSGSPLATGSADFFAALRLQTSELPARASSRKNWPSHRPERHGRAVVMQIQPEPPCRHDMRLPTALS